MVDRYFVLGNPVAHSQSPFIHEAFARATGQAMSYGRRRCPLEGFAHAVQALAEDRDGGPVRGCNITLPFKYEVPRLVRRLTPRAELAQAANVLCFDEPGWMADNTDGAGLVRDLQVNEQLDLVGRRVLVIGAGGAAAGVLAPLLSTGPARLCVANRTASKAQELAQRHQDWAAEHGASLLACGLDEVGSVAGRAGFDVIINASASSMAGSVPPIPASALADGCAAVDLMYGPPAQVFLSWARQHGASRTVDGLGMLVEQAAEAFALWRGIRPETSPVVQALRQRLATKG